MHGVSKDETINMERVQEFLDLVSQASQQTGVALDSTGEIYLYHLDAKLGDRRNGHYRCRSLNRPTNMCWVNEPREIG